MNDAILRQRATQAVIWAMPAVSSCRFRITLTSIGAAPNDVIYSSEPMDARHAFLTPNNQTPYLLAVIDTRPRPVVLDIPAANERVALFGGVLDAWEVPIEDVGPAGADNGTGGATCCSRQAMTGRFRMATSYANPRPISSRSVDGPSGSRKARWMTPAPSASPSRSWCCAEQNDMCAVDTAADQQSQSADPASHRVVVGTCAPVDIHPRQNGSSALSPQRTLNAADTSRFRTAL